MALIETQASRMRAPLFAAGQQWHVGVEHGRLVYQDERGLMDLAAQNCSAVTSSTMPGLRLRPARGRCLQDQPRGIRAGIVGAEWRRGCSGFHRAA
jgi:dihydrofolate synthase/folylpolyglutamate synthase